MPTPANSINEATTGICGFTGTAFVGSPATQHAIQIGSSTSSTLASVAIGTTGQVLQANTTADPTWSTATYPSTTTINQILYSSAANTVTGITAANNGTLISGTTGVPSWLANGTTGQVLTATTGSPPSWGTAPVTQVTGQRITATGAFTYTPTAGMKYVIVELVGGGGGGGGTAATTANVAIAGGGGGGAYAKFILTAAQVGASLTGSVGVGGTAATSGNNPGGNGGNTTLATSSPWTAAGGTGGVGGAAVTSVTVNAVNGGTVTTGTGTILVTASGGQTGNGTGNTTIGAFGSQGGSSIMGVGAPVAHNTVAPNGAVGSGGMGFGAGAGGATSFGTIGPFAGTAGQPGVAIFTEFV